MRSTSSIGKESTEGDETELSLLEILEQPAKHIMAGKGNIEEVPERFNSIVNFPNFLLHVLRVQTGEDIALDDKQLLKQFDERLSGPENDRVAFTKTFGYNLLRSKFLLDKYILKREFTNSSDRWSLQRLKWYSGDKGNYVKSFGEEVEGDEKNRQIMMLLAMFHVSTPTMVYKHWLNGVLNYLSNSQELGPDQYITFLKKLARAFLFNRYLTEEKKPFFDIIYKPDGLMPDCTTDMSLLDTGTAVENFVFNYLDYLLWEAERPGWKHFEFTFRSSVEHYYPQNPIVESDRISDKSVLNDFGNLCLISASKNSKLSNNMPEAKRDYYERAGCDSIKQRLMMDTRPWDETAIIEHGREMKALLLGQKKGRSQIEPWLLSRLSKR